MHVYICIHANTNRTLIIKNNGSSNRDINSDSTRNSNDNNNSDFLHSP